MTISISARRRTKPPGIGRSGAAKARSPLRSPWDVHEQIERTWHFWRRQAEFGHRGEQIILAIVVMARHSEESIAMRIAGGDQRVMHSTRGVFDQREDRTAPVAPQDVAGSGRHVQSVRASVFIGEKLAKVVSRKGPGVYDLLAMGIDDFHDPPSLHERCFSTTSGDFYQRHLPSSTPNRDRD